MIKFSNIYLLKSNFFKQTQNFYSYLKYSSQIIVKFKTIKEIGSYSNFNLFYPLKFTLKHFSIFSRQNVLFHSPKPYLGQIYKNFSTSQNSNQFANKNSKIVSSLKYKKRSTLYYIIAIGVLTVGLSYAAVPLYRIFCQAYSYGGTTKQDILDSSNKVESMVHIKDREITVRFNADIGASMNWNFKPQQTEVKVYPGETALAFYSARNPTDRTIIGISTYNVIPFEAGQYFNKIQCFCFEEQMLNPNEEVSMPVFFYIDPEYDADPKLEYVDEITLSYTFFEVKEGMNIPLPGFVKK